MSVFEAGAQTPRLVLIPDFDASAGDEVIELCELADMYLDPWQKFVIRNSLGEGVEGRWAASDIGLCVPRQNGKNEICVAREIAGLFLLEEQLMIHTAHQFKTAKEHFLRVLAVIEGCPEFSKRVKKVTRTHGEEGIELVTGQRLLFFARNKSSGRGFAKADFVAFDEAMFLPEVVMGAIVPAQSSSGNAQRWYLGSAVDQMVHPDGLVFSRVRQAGIDGTDPGLAWFEWSAPYDTPAACPDEMFTDPDALAQANPGLGIRITEQAVEAELRSLDHRTAAVERFGVGDWPDPTGDGQSIVSQEEWLAVENEAGKIVGPICIAFDVSPDRWTAIAVCGRDKDGNRQIEVIKHQPGTGWVVAELDRLDKTHNPAMIVCDGFGPAGSLLPELEDAGVKITTLNATDHGQACGMFIDAVQQQTIRHLGSMELRNAVKGAAVRPLNDAWAFSRKNSGVDISPLVAATFAHWAAATTDADRDWSFY